MVGTHQNQPTRKSSNGTNSRSFHFLTPAEIGRRSYVDDAEKENEKVPILKSVTKLKSPSNGSKHFMAPTIAAASKFTPSPRKMILVDRSDPIRTSISLSDGKATFFTSDFDKNHDVCTKEKKNEAVPEVPNVPKPLMNVSFKEVTFSPHNVAESFIGKGLVNSDLEHNPDQDSVKLSNIDNCCPKDNVLSSSEIDVVKVAYKGCDSDENNELEDSCMCQLSENLSFSEGLELSETGDSWERVEDGDVPKQITKPWSLRNWKSVCLVVVLLGAFMLSATNFASVDSFVPQNLNFELPDLSEVAEIAKVNFDELIGKVKQWSADSVSYLNEIVLPVLEVDKMGPLQFMNLTVLEDNNEISSLFDVDLKGRGFEGFEKEEEGEDKMEEIDIMEDMEEVEDEPQIEEVEDEMEEVEDETKEVKGAHRSFGSTVHMVSAPEPPDTELKTDSNDYDHISAETEKSQEENETGSSVEPINQGNQESFADMVSFAESPDTAYSKFDAPETSHNSYDTETEILLNENQICSSVESKKMVVNQESLSVVDFEDESRPISKGPESTLEESSIQAQTSIRGACLILLCLGAVAVKIYVKQLSKEASTIGDTNPNFNKKQREESCTSELSTSLRSSSFYQKKRNNTKRESSISSSEYSFGSPSYGSFTTYETIPIRHVDGDEEIVTPVRRSSRIRKQITSQ